MKEEVKVGPARGRGRSGRGTRGRDRGRCVNCGRGLDGLEDAPVGGGRGGAADRGGHGYERGCGRGHGGGRVSNIDWCSLYKAEMIAMLEAVKLIREIKLKKGKRLDIYLSFVYSLKTRKRYGK